MMPTYIDYSLEEEDEQYLIISTKPKYQKIKTSVTIPEAWKKSKKKKRSSIPVNSTSARRNKRCGLDHRVDRVVQKKDLDARTNL